MTRLLRQSLVAYGAPLCETIVDCPPPQGSEVLVRVERCGVCHSDLHIQDGYFKLGGDKKLDVSAGRALPFTLGHEIAGVVEASRPRRRDRRGTPGRGLSLDRLRRLPGLPARRGEPLRGAAPSRHRRRRRLCDPCASSRIRATSSTTRRCRRRWRAR